MKKFMKAAAAIMLMTAVVFAGCHKDPSNGGDDNGGGGDTPTETTCTVTFDANGGVGTMQPQIFNNGEARPLNPNSFTCDGHSFVSWNTKYDGSGTTYSDKQTITVTSDMTLYAQWGTHYTVTFDANGGTGEMQPQTFVDGVAQMLDANAFTKDKYVFANWNTASDGTGTIYADRQEITVLGNITLYAQWEVDVPVGAVKGWFSVSSTKKVYFSKGNLQYNASTHKYRFAETQLDYIGSANSNISSTYSGWIDLFGWGTGNNPTNTSTSNSDYSSYTEWGIKPISNGGNQANRWRTLTYDEWRYLVYIRTTTSGIRYAKAWVNGVAGVIILPDDWNTSYYTLSSTNNSDAYFSANSVSSSDWASKFEAHGAVFLPAAGNREGTSVCCVGTLGGYWSSSPYGSDRAYFFFVAGESYLFGMDYIDRFKGWSVRLVAEE